MLTENDMHCVCVHEKKKKKSRMITFVSAFIKSSKKSVKLFRGQNNFLLSEFV